MDIFKAIRAFVLKSRPAYKDYIGNGQYEIKKLPDECVPNSVTNGIRKAQSTADAARSTADAAQSTADAAQSTANEAAYQGNSTIILPQSVLQRWGNNRRSRVCYNTKVVDSDENGMFRWTGFKSGGGKIFDVELISTGILSSESRTYSDVLSDKVYKEKDTLLNYRTTVVSQDGSTKYDLTFIANRYSGTEAHDKAMELILIDNDTSGQSDLLYVTVNHGKYYKDHKLQFGAQTMADSTTLGLIRAPEAHDTDTLPVRIKSSEGTLWVEDTKVIPDWNQDSSSANDYIKNRPCYAREIPNYKDVQTGSADSTLISIDNSNSIAIYDKAVSYGNDVKRDFWLRIDNSSGVSVFNKALPFVSDSGGTRKYGDGAKVTLTKNVTDDKAYLGFADASLVNSDYTYTLQINDPKLTYYPLDDGYIPDTVQRVGGDVIIPSSTSGSTKKFKLTVDDSGTISASEVTT